MVNRGLKIMDYEQIKHEAKEEEYAKILESFNIPKSFAHAIASWDISASTGDLFDESGELSKLIERPTTLMAVSVKAAL